jgi:outer membrane receptor protein involved in Fe transport
MRHAQFTLALLATTALAWAGAPIAQAQETETAPEAASEEADSRTLTEIVVRGEFIPEPQQTTSQVASFLSADDLARTGDDNAALALTRLSGLSVVSGRFAYVRGLGDRYSSARLNGSPLPSPEPLRRTVPLDLFPSNILDGASVQKTFSADYPGEFGGGVINLKTLRVPLDPFLNVKVGVGYNTATTGKDGIFVGGGDYDWSGFDDGTRDIPGPIAAVLSSGQSLNSLTPAEIEIAGESLVNSPLSVIQSAEMEPSVDVSIDGGTVFNRNGYEIGFVGVAGFSSGWTTQNVIRQQVQGGVLGNNLRATETTYDATLNALGSATLTWDSNFLQTTLFYVHSTSKEAQIDTGTDFNAQGSTGEIFDESTGWFERELIVGQLQGEHEFGDFEFKWRGSLAQSTRDAPYERSLRRQVDASGVPLYSVANSYSIRFSDLKDTVSGVGADLLYALPLGDYRSADFSAGVDFSKTEREYNFLALRFVGGNSLPADVQAARPDFLFSPDNIDPNRFVLQEISTRNDSYAADLEVMAVYAQVDFEPMDYVRATFGLRYEDAQQTVDTFDRFGNPGAGDVDLSNSYVLPAATLTWNFADDLQLRLGYSQTIARPQFRELALSTYFDPEGDRVYRGNNGLVDSELTNLDARLEYYLGRNQFVTVAAFYKQIDKPIEEVQFSTSTFVFETTFINSPKAELYGAELEYRNRFSMPIDSPWFNDRDWLFSANYTYTSSEIQSEAGDQIFDPISRSVVDASAFALDGSVLQGTPENILNLQFGWESDADQLTLLVGWVDERVLQRGLRQPGADLPDVVEDPGVQVDLVYKRDFVVAGQNFTLGISGRNLLDEDHVEFQDSGGTLGRTDFNTYERGSSFSLSLGAKF